ncbi:carbon-nitrogen hydrolase family protein [uncultured Sphingomonas sp.]|uniref:carbon-nitrogen hydrolase family protein n=1 Tax=uncultured Sphingomonas sp. TaxID=158754 RepID=UPI0035CB9757
MRLALLQMTSGIDPAANARVLAEAVAEARSSGAVMIFTPEMSGLIDRERAARAIASEADDTVLAAVRKAAAAHGVWVHLGSQPIRREDGRLANRGFVIDDGGRVCARYDKLHLFDIDLATGERWRESAAYAAGEEAVAVWTPAGMLGLSICYDLRFPALYQALSGAGATLLAVPSAFTRPTGAAHWHLLLRARAVECAAFVIAAAQTGLHEDGRETFGHSLVVDPWGEVLLDMGEAPGVAMFDTDLDRIAQVRGRLPVIEHRRAIPTVRTAS